MGFKVNPNVIKGLDVRMIDAAGGELISVPYGKDGVIVKNGANIGIANANGLGSFAPAATLEIATFVAGVIAPSGMDLALTFSGDISAIGDDYLSGFILKADGEPVVITSADIDGVDASIINLVIDNVAGDADVILSYVATDGFLRDGIGSVESFTGLALVNNSEL